MRMWAGKWILEQEGIEVKIKLVDMKSSETRKISIIPPLGASVKAVSNKHLDEDLKLN